MRSSREEEDRRRREEGGWCERREGRSGGRKSTGGRNMSFPKYTAPQYYIAGIFAGEYQVKFLTTFTVVTFTATNWYWGPSSGSTTRHTHYYVS